MSKPKQTCSQCGFQIRHGFPWGRQLFCSLACQISWRPQGKRIKR